MHERILVVITLLQKRISNINNNNNNNNNNILLITLWNYFLPSEILVKNWFWLIYVETKF
jgi:hypothetical protein